LAHKIRVGAVSYLNTKPLVYGFEQGMMEDEIDLVIDYPANVAKMLVENKIDVGLIPVAAIPLLNEHYIISNYCIGCNGEVASVCLFSEVPVNEIETILLDYQSKTSVALLKILLKEYWKIEPKLLVAEADYESNIKGTIAGLVIGDRAFKQRLISPYIYDLGLAWKQLTGLPFVFAAWVSNKKNSDHFVQKFNEANKIGLDNLDEIVAKNECNNFNLKSYYTQFINFTLNAKMLEAKTLFLSKL
jgi:chorismate dehydratase